MFENKLTFTEAEIKLAKDGLDFLINKGEFKLTGVEAFTLAKQIGVLAKVPALMEQYLMDKARIVEQAQVEPEVKKKGKK